MGGSFDEQWAAVRPSLLRHCLRVRHGAHDAEDLLQQVAVRAWRGYSSFRGDCSFLTWTMRIADREVLRMAARAARSREAETRAVLERSREGGLDEDGAAIDDLAGRLPAAADRAACAGWISPVERDVIRGRLAQPDLSWKEVGLALGLDARACAVAHCRAVPRLRVYLVRFEPAVLGGREGVLAAFADALRDPTGPLTDAEGAAFRAIVVDGRSDYRARGWQGRLQRASAVVVGRMEVTIR